MIDPLTVLFLLEVFLFDIMPNRLFEI